ncbi:hypothetical protein F4778DRAFT_50317 [Xylariomycetidae sp. FL2044]|nr:hypothetical protein F4778DRAFT_50317 [Xylariomycetidae sp. FL2044]
MDAHNTSRDVALAVDALTTPLRKITISSSAIGNPAQVTPLTTAFKRPPECMTSWMLTEPKSTGAAVFAKLSPSCDPAPRYTAYSPGICYDGAQLGPVTKFVQIVSKETITDWFGYCCEDGFTHSDRTAHGSTEYLCFELSAGPITATYDGDAVPNTATTVLTDDVITKRSSAQLVYWKEQDLTLFPIETRLLLEETMAPGMTDIGWPTISTTPETSMPTPVPHAPTLAPTTAIPTHSVRTSSSSSSSSPSSASSSSKQSISTGMFTSGGDLNHQIRPPTPSKSTNPTVKTNSYHDSYTSVTEEETTGMSASLETSRESATATQTSSKEEEECSPTCSDKTSAASTAASETMNALLPSAPQYGHTSKPAESTIATTTTDRASSSFTSSSSTSGASDSDSSDSTTNHTLVPTNPPPNPTPEPSSLTTRSTIVAATVVPLVAVLLVIGVYVYRRRQKVYLLGRKRNRQHTIDEMSEPDLLHIISSPRPTAHRWSNNPPMAKLETPICVEEPPNRDPPPRPQRGYVGIVQLSPIMEDRHRAGGFF